MAASGSPSPASPIYASPMVGNAEYDGPDFLDARGDRIETNALVLDFDGRSGCLNFTEKSLRKRISTVCPADLDRAWKGISIDRVDAENAYGLGRAPLISPTSSTSFAFRPSQSTS